MYALFCGFDKKHWSRGRCCMVRAYLWACFVDLCVDVEQTFGLLTMTWKVDSDTSFSEWGLVNVEERTTQSLRRKNLATDQVWLSLTDNRPPVLFVCLYKRRFSFCIWIIQHQLLSLSVCVFNSDKGLYQVICWHNTVTQTTSVVCVCEVITNECEAIKGHHREHTLKHTTAFLKSCDI